MKEGSFEGLMSSLDFNTSQTTSTQSLQDEAIAQVFKTPNQLPTPLDFTHLPEPLLRNSVIESLISQNDDLMARLTISLRRLSDIEQKWSESQKQTAVYKDKCDNLNDQVLILKEQAKTISDRARQWAERKDKELVTYRELEDQNRILEIRYSELYSANLEKQNSLEQEIIALKTAISTNENNIHRWSRQRNRLSHAILQMREKSRSSALQKSKNDLLIQDLRKNITELTAHIAEQNRIHKDELNALTANYESEAQQLREQTVLLDQENDKWRQKANQAEDLYREKVRLENDLIIAHRREEELQIQTTSEIADIQKSLGRYRIESKELAIELNATRTELQQQQQENQSYKSERQAFVEQVETLQLLWREQQSQIEKLNEQKNALQKLNQELSMSINEYRRENLELKETLDAERQQLRTEERKQLVVDQISESKPDDVTPKIVAKINEALQKIHTGY